MKHRVPVLCLVLIPAVLLLVPGCRKSKTNTDDEGPKNNPIRDVQNQGGGPGVGGVLPSVGRIVQENDLKQFALWYLTCASEGTPPANMDALAKDLQMSQLYNKLKDTDIEVYWGSNPARATAGSSNTILAYSKSSLTKNPQKIPVAMLDGSARTMTKQEFDNAAKGAK
jgi:hypothetical protein